MGQFYDEIPQKPDLASWIEEQKIFFVGTAPLSDQGNVNISPKGTVGTFNIVDSTHVWYQDLTGSGSETIAHLEENERITIMFTAFEGPPRIVRLFGRGKAYFRGSPEYESYLPESSGLRMPGSRAVVLVEVFKVGSSCGYSIPFYDYLKDRDVLDKWATQKEECTDLSLPYVPPPTDDTLPPSNLPLTDKNDLRVYWQTRNSQSIDGLPSIGTFLFDPPKPTNISSKSQSCSSSSSPTTLPPTRFYAITSRLPSLKSVVSHALVGGVVGGAVWSIDHSLVDTKMVVGLVGATGAWVVGTLVGVPVPAPCCAMGM
ncbi:hypothetical protein BDY24DRAFT_358111 [Mrakia frigida]|uniref:pyridoxamine 5'-phosphate oxidase family protein n=1 Tax=Mrakia frigida TaxID=29902 RepID=UPI003FCBF98E